MVNTAKFDCKEAEHSRKMRLAIALALALIVLLGAFLRFYELGAHSIGNTYYAATVQSMLTSWHNFFFVAYEPGGSVTVDKPPLGFWIQAASASIFGVNGFALALPQALAGTLAIPLLYLLVKRQFGPWAALIAALVLALTPIAIATERNNTVDGLLVLTLLLATWAFWRAVESGRLHHLLLGALLVGLGFNIKMLQAILPLPAFYLLYLLGARLRWWKRLLYLGLATVVLVAVSLSWAIAVDLTPADERPYIGSSEDNTVLELIVGHNGLKRLNLSQLFGGDEPTQAARPPRSGPAQQGSPTPAPLPPGERNPVTAPLPQPPIAPGQGAPPASRPGAPALGGAGVPPGNVRQPPAPSHGSGGVAGQPGGGGRSAEVGEAGWLRLFSQPLVTEASWLLPLVLLGLLPALVALGRLWPLTDKHLALLLWAGWLLPEVVYFTFNSGLFHVYYLIMLGPPLAALVGAVVWALWRIFCRWRRVGWAVTAFLAVVTLALQFGALWAYPSYALVVAAVAIPLLAAALLLLALAAWRWRGWGRVAYGLVVLALLVAPLLWSGLTTFNTNPNVSLPRSGPDTGQRMGPSASSTVLSRQQEAILDYLLANTDPDGYLVAGLDSRDVSGYILATTRPALTFGGFNGGDDVVGVEELAAMVAAGELRFVLNSEGLATRKPEISQWLQSTCTLVRVPGAGPRAALYDCMQ